jgi:hypothetical protein
VLSWYNAPDSDFRLRRVLGLLQAGFADELPKKKAPMKFNIPEPAHSQIDRIQLWLGRFRLAGAIGILALVFATSGCRRSSPEAVTLTFIDAEGLHDLSSRKLLMDQALREFTLQTGIKVNYLPAPENNRDKLLLERKFLQEGSATPDVYGIDTIWTGNLSDYLIDLEPYFSSELASEDSALLAGYKSHGKQVAMPFHSNVGSFIIGQTCCTDMATAHRPEPGMSLRRWPSVSRPVSAPGERRTFGVSFGLGSPTKA